MSVLWTAGVNKLSSGLYRATITQTSRTGLTFTIQFVNYFTGTTEPSWLPSDKESEYIGLVYQDRYIEGFPYYWYSQTPFRSSGVARGESVGEYTVSYEYLPGGAYKFFVGIPSS